jgi:hypothetical protein
VDAPLDETNSRVYRPRSEHIKHAVVRLEPSHYRLASGEQVFEGPHVVVTDPAGNYGVALERFFATHREIVGRPDHYIKVVQVRAAVAATPLQLATRVGGRVEMVALVASGSYVIQEMGGERYAMDREAFELRYELDE